MTLLLLLGCQLLQAALLRYPRGGSSGPLGRGAAARCQAAVGQLDRTGRPTHDTGHRAAGIGGRWGSLLLLSVAVSVQDDVGRSAAKNVRLSALLYAVVVVHGLRGVCGGVRAVARGEPVGLLLLLLLLFLLLLGLRMVLCGVSRGAQPGVDIWNFCG